MSEKRNWRALGKAVRKRRQELDLGSQKEAADLAGVSLNTWGRLESGTPVSTETLDQAAKVLQWEISVPQAILLSQDAVARPETVRATVSIPQPAPAAAVVAPAAVVNASLPGLQAHATGQVSEREEALPVTALKTATVGQAVDDSGNDHVVLVPVRVSRADFDELDDKDIAWIARVAGRAGEDMARGLAEGRRRGRQ